MWKKLFIPRPLGKEKQMSNMGVYNPGPKKKDIKFLALAVVCVVLAAGLVGVIAVYALNGNGNSSDLKAQIAAKDNTINALTASNDALQSNITQTQGAISYYTNQISILNDHVIALNSQISGYYNIAIMNSSEILLSQQPLTQDANETTAIFSDAVYYAGYVSIQAAATANTTFAQVLYSYAGANFNYTQTIGTSGTAVFPVLPGTLQVNIGNINQTNTATVSANYYY